jgi:hypothetical protein
MSKLVINGIEVVYDAASLRESIEGVNYDEDSYTANSCHGHDASDYSLTEEEFNGCKNTTLTFIDSLNEEVLTKLLKGVRLNKNGSVNGRSRNVVIDMGNTHNYYDEYGSHSYDTNVLEFYKTGDRSVELVATERTNQDPF